jgi:hypothetical protein
MTKEELEDKLMKDGHKKSKTSAEGNEEKRVKLTVKGKCVGRFSFP